MSTGFPYEPKVDGGRAARVAAFWTSVYHEADQRGYVMRMFSRQLFGDRGDQLVHVHAGGKTKTFEVLEVLEACLGDYMRKFGCEVLVAKQRRVDLEHATWRGVRVLYTRIHSGILKDLTGGEVVTYRLLHSNVQRFRPQFKLHIVQRRASDERWVRRFGLGCKAEHRLRRLLRGLRPGPRVRRGCRHEKRVRSRSAGRV